MYTRARTATLMGLESQNVIVEVHRAQGLPGLTLIGLAKGAVKESVVRVRSALIASGVRVADYRLVVNLLPAEIPKDAAALDLPIAVALLAALGEVPEASLSGRRFFGELSLCGELESVRGAVLVADLARLEGDREVIVPEINALEAAVIPGARVLGARTLAQIMAHLRGRTPLPVAFPRRADTTPDPACLSEVRGQAQAKRALEVAAAGAHNLLMVGPPGSGKTMLARRMPGLLPPLSSEEAIELTRIYSAAGLLRDGRLVSTRPLRAPHHTASDVALCGGGPLPKPGEITLAHRGILFLDELPELSRRALESLREPLEEGFIHVSRAATSLCFPARVLLVAAMNPCPCGYFQERDLEQLDPLASPCVCAFEQIQRYRGRISGPLLDRIDLHVSVQPVPFTALSKPTTAETSRDVRARVILARHRQTERLGPGRTNASMTEREVQCHASPDPAMLNLIEAAMQRHRLSTRAVSRALKVARTVADLAGNDRVEAPHLAEALALRLLERSAVAI